MSQQAMGLLYNCKEPSSDPRDPVPLFKVGVCACNPSALRQKDPGTHRPDSQSVSARFPEQISS